MLIIAVINRCILLGIVNKDSPMPLGREIIEAAVKYHFMKDKKSADGVGKGAGISHTFNAVLCNISQIPSRLHK